MFSDDIQLYLIFGGFICLFLQKLFDGLWFLMFLISGILMLVFAIFMNHITIVKGPEKIEEYRTFMIFNHCEYIFSNGKKTVGNFNNLTIVNDTDSELIIESIQYGDLKDSSSPFKQVGKIKPFSVSHIENKIDFFYGSPPESIRHKLGKSLIKYWIHK